MDTQEKTLRRTRRRNRVRAKVSGTAARPRLSVFRSNTQITAQLIDDEANTTICSVTTAKRKGTPRERSIEAGSALAEAAKGKKVAEIVFDRGGYLYTGNIKAFADAVRDAGLKF